MTVLRSTERVVCGWYTPNYAVWAAGLAFSCQMLGESCDLMAVDPIGEGWEAETRRKPEMILRALERHRDKKVIAFIDADATVEMPLDMVSWLLVGEVGLHFRPRVRSRVSLAPRTGTLLLRPTNRVIEFVAEWARVEEGATDQDALALLLSSGHNIGIQHLPHRFCATEKDVADGLVARSDVVVLHDSASRGSAAKRSKIKRHIDRLKGWVSA